eukprot:s1973_g2.t1
MVINWVASLIFRQARIILQRTCRGATSGEQQETRSASQLPLRAVQGNLATWWPCSGKSQQKYTNYSGFLCWSIRSFGVLRRTRPLVGRFLSWGKAAAGSTFAKPLLEQSRESLYPGRRCAWLCHLPCFADFAPGHGRAPPTPPAPMLSRICGEALTGKKPKDWSLLGDLVHFLESMLPVPAPKKPPALPPMVLPPMEDAQALQASALRDAFDLGALAGAQIYAATFGAAAGVAAPPPGLWPLGTGRPQLPGLMSPVQPTSYPDRRFICEGREIYSKDVLAELRVEDGSIITVMNSWPQTPEAIVEKLNLAASTTASDALAAAVAQCLEH